jgi:hypothetical protein
MILLISTSQAATITGLSHHIKLTCFTIEAGKTGQERGSILFIRKEASGRIKRSSQDQATLNNWRSLDGKKVMF